MNTNVPSVRGADLTNDRDALDHAWRLAELFAKSTLIPSHLKDKPHDVLMGLAMASQLNMNPLVVLQSIYVINGRAGWAASFMIACVNASGRFDGPIRWREAGEPDSADYAVTAYANLAGGGDEVHATVSMRMAREEGWTRNKKYQTMGQHMLRLRAATFLIRLYAPEVMLGLHTADEVEDIEASRVRVEPVRVAEVVEDEAAASRTRRVPKPKVIDATPTPEDVAFAEAVAVERANREPAAEPEVVEAEVASEPPAVTPQPAPVREHHESWPRAYRRFFGDVTRTGRDKAIVMEIAAQCPDTLGKRPSQMDDRERGLLLIWLQTPEGQHAYAKAVIAQQTQAGGEVQS